MYYDSNSEAEEVLDFCDDEDLTLLSLDMTNRTFKAKSEIGEVDIYQFEAVPELNYLKPEHLTRDGLLHLIKDYNTYHACSGAYFNVSQFLNLNKNNFPKEEKIQVVAFEYDESYKVIDHTNDFYVDCRIQTNSPDKHENRMGAIYDAIARLSAPRIDEQQKVTSEVSLNTIYQQAKNKYISQL